MEPQPGYYSLVQFCPDVSRLEAVNVGVVLFCPGIAFLDVQLTTSDERVAQVFGSEEFRPASLEAAKRALASRLRSEKYRPRSLEEFQHFIDTRGNDLVLTPLRPVKVVQPAEELADLFRRLVERPPGRKECHSGAAPLPVEAIPGEKNPPVVGVVENGLIRPLDPNGKLPEGSQVIIVAAESPLATGQPCEG
jgi:hypothetical protein